MNNKPIRECDNLNIGDKSSDLKIEIVDKDRLCYLVKTKTGGGYRVQTIAKQLLQEFIDYFKRHPNHTATAAKNELMGKSVFDKSEYMYAATLRRLAQMIINPQKGYTDAIYLPHKQIHQNILGTDSHHYPLQQIYYGAPGTGKSYEIDEITKEYDTIRTTFHPDSDYSSFVGAYKPTMTKVDLRDASGQKVKENNEKIKEDRITYKFVKQAFLRAYLAAWKKYGEVGLDGVEPQFLIIEEINRGNCAQIFGDLFQLLDRQDNGFSSYPIEADADLQREIAEAFAEENGEYQLPEDEMSLDNVVKNYNGDLENDIRNGRILLLPSNLYIWATMNTSDQSLFPIDSAFKRRWDWHYVKIADAKKDYKIKCGDDVCDWWTFISAMNEKIAEETNSDDKKLGYFFCKPEKGSKYICEDLFVSKVIFYLWNDIFKDSEAEYFKVNGATKAATFDAFYNDKSEVDVENVRKFLVNIVGEENLAVANEEDGSESNNETDNNNDNAKFRFNGKPMPMTKIVEEIVLQFAENNPQLKTAESMIAKFKDLIAKFNAKKDKNGKFGTTVLRTEDEYHELDGQKNQKSDWKKMTLKNGVIYIYTQWRGNDNFIKFISFIHANNWGEITPIS